MNRTEFKTRIYYAEAFEIQTDGVIFRQKTPDQYSDPDVM